MSNDVGISLDEPSNGNIVFQVGGPGDYKEIIRLESDGTIFVKGKLIKKDIEVYFGLKEFLKANDNYKEKLDWFLMINNPLLGIVKDRRGGYSFTFESLMFALVDKDEKLFSFVMPNTTSIRLVGEAMIKLAKEIDEKESVVEWNKQKKL